MHCHGSKWDNCWNCAITGSKISKWDNCWNCAMDTSEWYIWQYMSCLPQECSGSIPEWGRRKKIFFIQQEYTVLSMFKFQLSKTKWSQIWKKFMTFSKLSWPGFEPLHSRTIVYPSTITLYFLLWNKQNFTNIKLKNNCPLASLS